jgi:hypothetical protein
VRSGAAVLDPFYNYLGGGIGKSIVLGILYRTVSA